MSRVIEINLPDGIEHYGPDLQWFMQTMVQKLYVNRHKGFADRETARTIRIFMAEEIRELDQALAEGSQFDCALEAVDVANFAWLMALVCLRMSKETFEGNQK